MMMPQRLKAVKPYLFVALILLTGAASAQDAVFRDVQLPISQRELVNASLRFSDQEKQIEILVSDGRRFVIPYQQVGSVTYEYTTRHRIKEAIVLGVISPWSAGAVIGFTKAKNHWLEIDFHDQDSARALVLKLDKRDFQQVYDAARSHTGRNGVPHPLVRRESPAKPDEVGATCKYPEAKTPQY